MSSTDLPAKAPKVPATSDKTETSLVKQPIVVDENAPLVLDIEHVSKSFGSKQVLKDINLKVRKQENVVVLGKSGTGKSVLIKCIVGLLKPDAGKLEVLGKDVMTINDREMNLLRKEVGFLFQSGALYDSMTVRENMEFPLLRNFKDMSRPEVDNTVLEALTNVGLADAINKYPSELSGGMKKRIGLARTLILKPKIMLYDEPTTGLDPVTSHEISQLIVEMQEKYQISSIIITHDIACARVTSNRMVILRDGEYKYTGTFDELENSEDPWIQAFFQQ